MNGYILIGGLLIVGLILLMVLPMKLLIGETEGFQSQSTERKAYKIRYLKNDPWKPEIMREWNTITREEKGHLQDIQGDIQSLFKRYQTILESQVVGATKQYESWKTMSPQVRILANQKENPVQKFFEPLVNTKSKTSRVLGSQSMVYPDIIFQKSLPLIIIPEPPIAPELSPEITGVDQDVAEIPFYEKIPNYLMSIPPLLPTIQDNVSKLQESIAGKSKEGSPEYSLYERVEILRLNTEKAKRDAEKLKETQKQKQKEEESQEGFQESPSTLDIVVPNSTESLSVIQKRIVEVYEPTKEVLDSLERKMTKTEQTLKDLQEDAERVKRQAN
jgi:hypothetical protein